MTNPRRVSDMHHEDIKASIRKKGWTFSAIEKAYGLPKGTISKAARRPLVNGELAIAEILSLSPRQIWPSRFKGDVRLYQVRNRGKSIQFSAKRHCQKQEAA